MADLSNEDLITEALHRGLDTIPEPLPPLPEWPDKLLLETMALRLKAAAPALPSTSEEVAGMVKRLREAHLGAYTQRDTKNICGEAATLLEALDAKVRNQA